MPMKVWLCWICEQVRNYNLFAPEIEEYPDDEHEEEREDPQINLQHQKYATRLYIILLSVSLYVLFYVTLIQSNIEIVTIDNINENLLNNLSIEYYSDNLTCPCSKITIPHETFVFNRIEFHPICSSIFVSKQWIEGLYLPNASYYRITDFRLTARAQFQLLSDFCSVCKEKINENVNEFNRNEFVSVDLLTKEQIESEINATIEMLKKRLSTEMISFFNYLRIYIRSNYFVSSLNTNFVLSTFFEKGQYVIHQIQTQYEPHVDLGRSKIRRTLFCGTDDIQMSVGFFPIQTTTNVYSRATWIKPTPNISTVNGFYAGCLPLEAILLSTLDCLYQQQCIQLLIDSFPNLTQLNLNSSDLILESENRNITVNDHISNLFVDEWSHEMNYSSYFDECFPLSCSYRIRDRKSLSYAITIFISLYGGLIVTLRFVSWLFIRILFQIRKYTNRERTTNRQIESVKTYSIKLMKWVQKVNLFKHPDRRSENELYQQKLITRIYFVLFFCSILILLILNCLFTTTVTKPVSNPSLTDYRNYVKLYGNRFRCSCSNRIIGHDIFLSISPTIHQICSSDFVIDEWLSIVTDIYDYLSEDWRNRAYGQFHLLNRLCQLANATRVDSITQFLSQSIILSNLLTESEFEKQINTTLNEFIQSTVNSFVSLTKIQHIFTQTDQFYMGLLSIKRSTIPDRYLTSIINNQTHPKLLKIKFNFYGHELSNNLSSSNCSCPLNSSCQSRVAIYQMDYIWNSRIRSSIDYIVPGSVLGCSNFDSLLFSDLFCFYSNSDCFPIVMKYLKESYFYNMENPQWFDPKGLISNSTLSRYPPNTSISNLIEQLMIEQWNSSYSYEKFFDFCQAELCSYTETIRRNTIINVLIIVVSTLGGLSISLRLVTPWIIITLHKFYEFFFKASSNRLNHFRLTMRSSALFLYDSLINLNIFSIQELGSNIDRRKGKLIGKWSTRLYICLFLLSLSILTIYTLVQPETSTKTYSKPSFEYYNQLKSKHKHQLKCSCSRISSKYETFTRIQPMFHQICRNRTILNEREVNHGSIGEENNDYRRLIVAHLKYIQRLCEYSIEIERNSIEQFLNSLLITSELLSKKEFSFRVNSSIEQRKEKIPKKFSNLLFLIRSLNHGNGFVSMYGTNYEYSSTWFEKKDQYLYLNNQAIVYDDQCSCELHSYCSTQAYFFNENSSKVFVNGLKMGCTPSESLHVSTLECFYDELCVDLIREYTNLTIISLVNETTSRFHSKTNVSQLIDNLFVEKWLTSMNYSSYYEQCLPSSCSYTYVQHFHILYFITFIFGLQGGLTIVLDWISPRIVRIIFKIYEKRKKQLNAVGPECSTIKPSTVISQQSTLTISNRSSTKFVVIFFFLLLLITGLILFSISMTQLTPTDNSSAISSTTTTTTTTTIVNTTIANQTTTSKIRGINIIDDGICQLKFELIRKYESGSKKGLKSPVVADFNNDKLVDILFFNYGTNSLHVLLGDGRGNYTKEIRTYVESFTTWAFYIATGDLDHDANLDLVLTSENRDYVYFLFGYGNGSFSNVTTYYMGNYTRTRGIGIVDLNNDSHLDVALASQSENYVFILLGHGNRSFASKISYYAGPNRSPSSLSIGDMNNDGYQDIVYNNIMKRTVGILLGNGDGTFRPQIESFVGGYYNPAFVAIGDFNGDRIGDVVISYSEGNQIGFVMGYGNGSMRPVKKYPLGNNAYYGRITTGDFNNDGFADVVAGSIADYHIFIYVSNRREQFHIQQIYSTKLTGRYSWMNVAHFNDDQCQDIIASDETSGTLFILLNTCLCQHPQEIV